jgi:hypothetical protein
MLTHGDDEDDDRLHEVHPRARVRIAEGIDTSDDKRRHQAGEDDPSKRHNASDQPGVAELRSSREKRVTPDRAPSADPSTFHEAHVLVQFHTPVTNAMRAAY